MSELLQNNNIGDIAITSSLKGACWRNQPEPGAFERWHFDALSDDGREILIISFHDNFALSPRYFNGHKNANGKTDSLPKKVPAVSLIYSIDGKVILRSVNELSSDQFAVSADGIACSIGTSSFTVETASYGSGFIIRIDLLTAGKRRIKAELEWLSIESDLSADDEQSAGSAVSWNMVAPRSDVSGRISLIGRRGKLRRVVHFRGTGYHDHFRSGLSIAEAVGSRFWGRAHFIDSTAVFHHHETENSICSKLFLIRDGKIHERDVPNLDSSFSRNSYGLKLPERISLRSEDNIRLRVKPIRVIQSGVFETKVSSEMTLMLRDGKPRKTIGITELITPALMRLRLFRWMADMRIGKNGKGPMF